MGPNHRAIEREIAARRRKQEEAREGALALDHDRARAAITIWNAELAARKNPFFSPTIGATLLTRHHWLHVICPACGVTGEIDLTIKRRDPALTIAQVLPTLVCWRCQPCPPEPKPLRLATSFQSGCYDT